MAKKARNRKRQTKINFSPAAKSSPSSMGATPSKSVASASHATTTQATPSRLRNSRKSVVDISSEDELAAETHKSMSLGMPGTTTEHGMFGSSDKDDDDDDSSESEQEDEQQEGYAKPKLRSRKRRRGQDGSASDSEVKQRKGKGKAKVTVVRTKRTRRHSPTPELSEESEDDGDLRLPPSKRIKVTRRQPTPEDDEDEDDVVEKRLPGSRRRKASRRQSTPEEEERTPAPRSRRCKVATRQRALDVPNDSTSPRSKRRKTSRRPATPSEDENGDDDDDDEEGVEDADNGAINATEDDEGELEDLEEDLAFLQSSPVTDRGKLRSAHEKPKNERQKALEALKRKRAGTNEPSSSATPGRSRRVVIESESDSELEVIKEEVESDAGALSDPDNEDEDEEEQASDRDANALDMFLEDEEDAGFIDNDVDALIGEPILGPDDFMPLVMQRMQSSKPKELFKHAIEWMVMKKIHPGFDANSQIYTIVFRKLDDEVKGLANSKFSSSAWTPDFTRAIRARPDLMSEEIGKQQVMELHCEACNRRNHPATFELMFTGQPYNKETLEPLDNDSDSEDTSNSDNESELSVDSNPNPDANGEKPAYNEGGERLPPESRRFALGRTCKANAQVAHTLHHWRYHLYSWVKDYLSRKGHLSAEMLVKRDSWSDKKREKAALKIVKGMETDGEIKKLYHLYKDQISYAVEVRHDLENRWGRG